MKSKILALFVLFFYVALYGSSEFRATEYIVNQVYIRGNRAFTSRRLIKELSLKPKGTFRAITFTRRLLELDRLNLETFYLKNGYLNCSVTDSFSVRPGNLVDIYFRIKEGKQYYLHGIKVKGAKSFSEKRIIELLNHKLNRPYNPVQIQEGIRQLKREYANIGKPLVVVKDSLVVNSNVVLLLNIIETPPLYVEKISVVNNKNVKSEFITRELVIKSGDRFSQEKLELSEQRIYDTGLFSNVRVRPSEIDTLNKKINLVVDVRELEKRYLGMDIGLGQSRGIATGGEPFTSFNIAGEWLNRNINGKGRRISLKLRTAINLSEFVRQPQTSAEVYLLEPWLLGFKSSTIFRVFIENQVLEELSQTNYGSAITMILQQSRRSYFDNGFEARLVRFYSKIDSPRVRTAHERSWNFNFRNDRRDNFIYPSRGLIFTSNGKIVYSLLGGTQSYFKFEAGFNQYFTPLKPFTIAYRIKIGWMESLEAGIEPPPYEKFYLGGSNSLRGWPERQLLTKEEGGVRYPLGANLRSLTNLELRFPIFWRIGGEVFLDGGVLADKFTLLQKSQYRWNWGFGITVATPLGPIRVDYGRKINPRGDEKKSPYTIQFGIPYAF